MTNCLLYIILLQKLIIISRMTIHHMYTINRKNHAIYVLLQLLAALYVNLAEFINFETEMSTL